MVYASSQFKNKLSLSVITPLVIAPLVSTLLTIAALSIFVGSSLAEQPTQPQTPEATMKTDDLKTQSLFDFGPDTALWPSIDDVVMGGVSSSEMSLGEKGAVFRGQLSLENNGGFASVRSRPIKESVKANSAGLVLRVLGDGRTYGVRLRTTASFDGVSYQAPLATEAGTWISVRIPFDEFEPVYRGRRVAGYPTLRPEAIKTFGFILADKQPGSFRLEIDSIEAYRE